MSSSNGGKAICPMPVHLVPDAPEKFVGDLSFHHLNMIISGVCTAVTCLIIFVVMYRHATHLSDPKQQVKIMRIATLFPLYTIYSFLSVCFPNAYVYLVGWTKLFQGIALYWFLMLLCDFITPDDRHRAEFFASVTVKQRFSRTKTTDALSSFKTSWYFVIQYPAVVFILAIAQCATQAMGTYCLEGNNAHFAHIWINIIQIISLSMAIASIIRFHNGMLSHMQEHKPMMKFFAFKAVVGLEFLEQIIFMILDSTDTLKPSSTLNYADIIIGLPTLIICLQMVPFACFFFYAYSIKPYTTFDVKRTSGDSEHLAAFDSETGSPGMRRYKGGALGVNAWIALFNPGELYRSIRATRKMFNDSRPVGQKETVSTSDSGM